MKPDIRYQAAILNGHFMLLLKVWDHAGSGATFWAIPGGGREPDETEEECVIREAREETHLEVEVERLIAFEPDFPDGAYQYRKTYTCRILRGEPHPGTEPEVDTPERSAIQAMGWFDLRDPQTWDPLALEDPITMRNVQRVRVALGYADGGNGDR